MSISDSVLRNEEKAIFKLRELYSRYGYQRYKVSKFEEYDLYARNKSFLISENILTFTDTDGKLMALKPDVTLSIIKNLGKDEEITHKLYYNENVYRTSASADGFREIMQTGLECIGKIDIYSVCEVILLAQKSLELISEENILDLSHMGFMLGLMDNLGIDGVDADSLIDLVAHKNIPAIRSFCAEKGISDAELDDICKVTSLYAPIKEALEVLRSMVRGEKMRAAYDELSGICEILARSGNIDKIYIDFSTVNDMSYYNGVTFKGFVNGIPDGILSGGRYDRLMRKMGKDSGAIGFAVYLDMLERLSTNEKRYDVDAVLLYSSDEDVARVFEIADEQRALGKTVKAVCGDSSVFRCKELMRVAEGGVEILETND